MQEMIGDRILRLRRITDAGCWEWCGYKNNGGYGMITVDGKNRLVHREAARLWAPDFKAELPRLHKLKCPSRSCFNPAHTYSGSLSQNMLDAVAKGTHVGYETHHFNSDKTHCPQGHSYLENGYVYRGKRYCIPCKRQQVRDARKRARMGTLTGTAK